MNLSFFVKLLINQLISLLPEEWRDTILQKVGGVIVEWTREKIDYLLDLVEEAVTTSENLWDDNLLFICLAIRNLLDIPEYEEAMESSAPLAGTLERVMVYPTPYIGTRSELYSITNETVARQIEGYIFFGFYRGDTYYIKKKK